MTPTSPSAAAADREAVLDALRTYLEAIERKDPDAAIRMFAEEAVTFDFAPPLENHFNSLSDPSALEEWFETWVGPISTEIGSAKVMVMGSLAVVHGLQRLHGRKKNDGDLSMWYRATFILSRREDGWRITHMHNSVPMAMDGSGKALTELKPA
ncbi:YybH family protein [Hydrogenophaga sp. BPS33]|uniref:YybH family protein n=1 Tax=Hydrogenophaga sp. BPS33 TaxID=2651974 RepID=UPI00135B2EF7|nr:nuclear transport factor 2 family protein [Hydrogenophaga sp. BPS33]